MSGVPELFGSLVFLAMIPFGNPLIAPATLPQWGNLLALAIIPTVLSLFCTSQAIHIIGPTPTAIFGAMEPVTAVLLSVFALGQTISAREIAGAVLILTATTLVVVGDNVEGWLLHVRKMFPPLRGKKKT